MVDRVDGIEDDAEQSLVELSADRTRLNVDLTGISDVDRKKIEKTLSSALARIQRKPDPID